MKWPVTMACSAVKAADNRPEALRGPLSATASPRPLPSFLSTPTCDPFYLSTLLPFSSSHCISSTKHPVQYAISNPARPLCCQSAAAVPAVEPAALQHYPLSIQGGSRRLHPQRVADAHRSGNNTSALIFPAFAHRTSSMAPSPPFPRPGWAPPPLSPLSPSRPSPSRR